MFNPLPSTTIGALEQTLSFTERRHELLAGNIANLSTPDYRSRDLDLSEFQTALADSIRRSDQPSVQQQPTLPKPLGFPGWSDDSWMDTAAGNEALGKTGESGLSKAGPIRQVGPAQAETRDDRFAGPRHAMEQIVYHDNSDVSLEQQVTEISKNKHLHSLAISVLRNQFDLLRTAISERA